MAAGAEDPAVRLCDPASGGFTHVLAGHRAAVWAIGWSRTSEWHLVTGAANGQVRTPLREAPRSDDECG